MVAMSQIKRDVMERVEKDVDRVLAKERSARDVLIQTISEGVPIFLSFRTRGRLPSADSLERIASKLLAIVVATEEAQH